MAYMVVVYEDGTQCTYIKKHGLYLEIQYVRVSRIPFHRCSETGGPEGLHRLCRLTYSVGPFPWAIACSDGFFTIFCHYGSCTWLGHSAVYCPPFEFLLICDSPDIQEQEPHHSFSRKQDDSGLARIYVERKLMA